MLTLTISISYTTLVNMVVLYAEVLIAFITVPSANGEACTTYSNWFIVI